MPNVPILLDEPADMAAIKALRTARRIARGLMTNTSTSYSSRDRRSVLNRASVTTPSLKPFIIRKRLRKGWALQAALTTAQG